MRGKMSKAGQWSVGLLLVFVLLMMLLCAGCGKTANADQTTWGRADAKEIDVNSKIAGRVVELLVKEGDTVKEGQVIARIDKRSLEAQKAETMLQNIEVSLDETEIRAPFDGVITQKYIEEGSMISNGTPLVAVQDPEDNWIDIKVPETKLSKYHVSQEVTLIGRDNQTKVTGTITDISKTAEFATQRATSERGHQLRHVLLGHLQLRDGIRAGHHHVSGARVYLHGLHVAAGVDAPLAAARRRGIPALVVLKYRTRTLPRRPFAAAGRGLSGPRHPHRGVFKPRCTDFLP